MKLRIGCLLLLLLAVVLSSGVRVSGTDTNDFDHQHSFRLHSGTFENQATLPLSTIATFPTSSTNPSNACTFNGEAGGDTSPELSWTGAPEGTRSFVVVMYDVTASFTHWGMYNISGRANGLPANAGVVGSNFGDQINNDYGIGDQSYDGPCPPTGVTPLVHHYVFTVYALDTTLPKLPTFGVFLPGAQALYHALLKAGREGHILASASISGFYSAAAPPGPGE
jgi:Raf kinase inhibitor-like YbhB/YbcL family protein